jgi:uncharacterized RDD family membrane protein YckC
MNTDPYAPPASSLGGPTPAQVLARENGIFVYASFWHRMAAGLVDSVIMAPLFVIDAVFGGSSQLFPLYMLITTQVLIAAYIYMIVKFGGTPGKLMLGMRIAMVDGAPVTLKAALLRNCVIWALGLLSSAMVVRAAFAMTPEAYVDLDYFERSAAMSESTQSILIISILMQVWLVTSAIAFFISKKNRALHDLMAGTIVIRK